MKKIALLGSTGSIGRNVLDIVRTYPERYKIVALAGNKNHQLLAEQVNEFCPDTALIVDEGLYPEFKKKVSYVCNLMSGEEHLGDIAAIEDADIVFISIAGTAALLPLTGAIKAGKTIALASKEPIVSGGQLIMSMVREYGAEILPVDSEHSAIKQCIDGYKDEWVEKLYITGTGGSLWGKDKPDPADFTIEDVLSHPKWDMGRKITVDSATLMNKGLELIEARWLFDVAPDKIEIVIHPEAIIHSMVQFIDGTIRASLFCPDMRFPILRALSHPDIQQSVLQRVDFTSLSGLSFHRTDNNNGRAILLAVEALNKGGTLPAVLNGANEAAVSGFLEGKIGFSEIIPSVEEIINKHVIIKDPSLSDIIDAEKWAHKQMGEKI